MPNVLVINIVFDIFCVEIFQEFRAIC